MAHEKDCLVHQSEVAGVNRERPKRKKKQKVTLKDLSNAEKKIKKAQDNYNKLYVL